MNRGIIWTPELDDALLRLRESGLSMMACSKRIGISHPVLTKRCRDLGIKVSAFRWTEGRDRQLHDLRSEGLSWTKVAKRIGTSAGIAHHRARILGIDTTRKSVWTKPRIDLLIQLRAEGYGWRRITKRIGLSSHACRERAAMLGLYPSPAFAGSEVGHPSNTAARVAASVTVPPQTDGSGDYEPIGAVSFEEAA